MDLHVKSLFIDRRSMTVEEVCEAYKEDLTFSQADHVKSLHTALQKCMEQRYDVCFLSEAYPEQEVRDFFRDYEKIQQDGPCVFIQVRDSLDLDFDRRSLQPVGFATILTKKGDFRDKNALWEALKPIVALLEKNQTHADVNRAVEVLMQEVDRAAREKKRGRKVMLNSIYSDFVEDEANRDPELLDEFFDTLTESVEEAAPFKTVTVNIPDKVLDRKLPHLTKEGYSGTSHRVWEKLLDKHGQPIESVDQQGGDQKSSLDPMPVDHEPESEDPK